MAFRDSFAAAAGQLARAVTTVRAFPRLHITLHDLGHATYRRYGGVGLSLEEPHIEIEAVKSSRSLLEGVESLLARDRRDISSALEALRNSYPDIRASIRIKQLFPQHVGLGSKTALVLAALVAATGAAGITVPPRELIRLSQRGGTSGIGVHAFFRGGLIVDGGQPDDPRIPFGPSSSNVPRHHPLLLIRRTIPRSWVFHLLLSKGKRLSGREERAFFRDNTPISRSETLEVIALTYHGLVPAFAGPDFQLLRQVLSKIQRLGFKAAEMARQNRSLHDLWRVLENDQRFAVGLSSVGPLLFAISDEDTAEIARDIAQYSAKYNTIYLGSSRGRNRGIELL